MAQDLRWWAEGDLLDACNCELLCPCHVSFRQKATYDTCEAIWGVTIQCGEWGQTPLDGLKAVIVAFAPGPLMIDGGWTSLLYIDDKATPAQEEALTTIFSGTSGGPWSRLAVFFTGGKYQSVKRAEINFSKEQRARRIEAPGIASLDIEAIRSVNPDEEVKLINLRNVFMAMSMYSPTPPTPWTTRASSGRTWARTASTAPFAGMDLRASAVIDSAWPREYTQPGPQHSGANSFPVKSFLSPSLRPRFPRRVSVVGNSR